MSETSIQRGLNILRESELKAESTSESCDLRKNISNKESFAGSPGELIPQGKAAGDGVEIFK